MAFTPLADEIKDYNKNKYINTRWIAMYPYLKENYTLATTIKTVTVTDGNKYKGDLAGLFKHVIGVRLDFILPHILANGYHSSTDYDGTQLEFIVLNDSTLNRLLTMMQRSKTLNDQN